MWRTAAPGKDSLLKQVESERRKRELLWTDRIMGIFPGSAQMGGGRGVRREGVTGSTGREDGGKVEVGSFDCCF